jgi:hypothetical protein
VRGGEGGRRGSKCELTCTWCNGLGGRGERGGGKEGRKGGGGGEERVQCCQIKHLGVCGSGMDEWMW